MSGCRQIIFVQNLLIGEVILGPLRDDTVQAVAAVRREPHR